jgi:hypothetical protein
MVVDSFIRFGPGAENVASETQRYMGTHRRRASFSAAIVILHHVDKVLSAKEYRGSSDIKASV